MEWAGGGYAHVIESEDKFPREFGIDVVAGMLGIPPRRFDRRQKRTTFDDERKKVLKFLDGWSRFDWTTELDGGDYMEEKGKDKQSG